MSQSTRNGNPNPDSDEPQKRYAVHSHKEILFLLRAIQQRNLLVNLAIPDSGNFIITSVLALNEIGNTLIFDCAQNDALNRRLTSGNSADFTANLEGVQISFSTGKIESCEFENRPALRTAVPGLLTRLQRREYFRIMMPVVHPVTCFVPPAPDTGEKPVTANVMDLGCGGVSITETGGRLNTEIGNRMADCRLLLPEVGTVITTLEVCNATQIRLRNGTTKTRLGCRFVDLPNVMANLLQRYIMHLERERRSR
jgi:flagellar brake protein